MQWRSRHRHATHSCAPPARSDVRFAAERSALPKVRQLLRSEIVSGIGTPVSIVSAVNARTFFTELKRRRVYSVAVAYVVVGWLLIQVATQVFPFFNIPNWIVRLVVLLSFLGFPIAVVCAWAFEMTPEGIKLEGDVDRRITRKTGRKLTALVVIIAAIAAGVTAFRFLHSHHGTEAAKQPPLGVAIESKSIAVLPFENLSEEKANAY